MKKPMHGDESVRDGGQKKRARYANEKMNGDSTKTLDVNGEDHEDEEDDQEVMNDAIEIETETEAQMLEYVLVYALLFFRGGLRPVGREEKRILRRASTLRAALARLLVREGVDGIDALCPPVRVMDEQSAAGKTVRVNTLRLSLKEALSAGDSGSLNEKEDVLDPFVDGVVHVRGRRRSASLHASEAVRKGHLVMQSWSSCLPAAALNPAPGLRVIDACAAPGNKTTQLAALVGERGRVYAFDRNATRLETLQANVTRAGAQNIVKATCRDFLDVCTDEFPDVRALLLDPSCSGSGTAHTRGDLLVQRANEPLRRVKSTDENDVEIDDSVQHASGNVPAADSGRIAALAAMQLRLLLHALAFPSLERLVYSTCSVYREENEDVVAQALPHAKELGWRIGHPLTSWHRRGLAPRDSDSDGDEDSEHAKYVRVDPFRGDTSEGFFLVLFERDTHTAAPISSTTTATSIENTTSTIDKKKNKKKKKKRKRPSTPTKTAAAADPVL